MNDRQILRTLASRLFLDAQDTNFIATVIAVAALRGLRNSHDAEYINTDILHTPNVSTNN